MYGKQEYKEIALLIAKISKINGLSEKQLLGVILEFSIYFKANSNSFNEIAFRAMIKRQTDRVPPRV